MQPTGLSESYTLFWFLATALVFVGAVAYVVYILRQRKKGKTGFDIRTGRKSSYKGPVSNPQSVP